MEGVGVDVQLCDGKRTRHEGQVAACHSLSRGGGAEVGDDDANDRHPRRRQRRGEERGSVEKVGVSPRASAGLVPAERVGRR